MSMIAKENGNANIPVLENGVYMAICNGVIDLGIQSNEQFGNKSSRKMMIQWQIVGETVEINGEELPRRMQKQYGFSLNSKANLRKDLEAWRGRAFTSEELRGFDLANIINVPCQLQVLVKERVGKDNYNDIGGIMALPKGNGIQKLEDRELLMLDLEDPNTFEYIKKVPRWIQDRIKQAENYESSGLKKYVDENIKDEENGEYITIDTSNEELPF